MALYVRKKPTGISTKVDSHIPVKTLVTSSLENFSPKVLSKWNTTKKMMAKTNGVPKPPLRIIEPNGAPIKNKTMQATD